MNEEKMGFEFKDEIISDVHFEATGKTINEVFENSALALFSIMYETDKIKPEQRFEIASEGEDKKELLFNFLTDLIILIETKNMFFSEIKVRIEGNEAEKSFEAKAFLRGSPAKRDELLCIVKGVTFYKFDLRADDNKYKATVTVDI